MGTTEDRDWVSVANDLLRSCHINQHIKHLSECGADVFVHLYESILREKVPDLIATPRSQEDDAHNVQAVIDSLALDYLQVSLSHITGENIVKGEKESIRNLLEIFDGLLEYLTEEDSESQDGVQKRETETGHGEGQEEGEEGTSVAKLEEANVLSSHEIQTAAQERLESNAGQLKQPSIFSSGEGSQSEFSVPSCDVDGSESTSELIRLGDTAYSFSKREEEFKWPELLQAGKDKGVETSKHSEAFTTFPRQFSETERVTVKEKEDGSMESVHATEPQTEILSVSATKLREPIQQAIPLLPPFQPSEGRPHYPGWRDFGSSASQSAALAESQGVTASTLEKSFTEKADDVSGSPFLSRKIPVREEVVSSDAEDNVAKVPHISETSASASSSHQKLSLCAEQVEHTPEPWYLPRSKSRHEGSTTDSLEESLSHRTTKEKLSEQELHEVSENISHRLNELDLMLKRALGGHTREEELTDEDNLSQHSDSVMDYRWRKAERDTPHLSRPRSLSPASPSSQHQLFSDLGGKPSIKGTSPIRKIRSQLQKEQDERTKNAKMVAKAYEDELRIYKARERLRLSKLREVTKEMEQEYKENIFKEPPKMPQPVKAYSRKTTPRNPKYSQWIPKRGTVKPKKAAPIKGRGDDLLHQLLEEFPHLHISRHTMNKMWQQQLAHTGQLKAASDRNRGTLQNEVQQALKKHELLVAIIKKDQDHNKRLQELKQRICRQKWAQNKVREKRQQVARARKYYEDYRVQLRAKMMRARTREERIFKNLFEEGLEIQRQRLKDLRAYAKEKRAEQRREHQNELESMENYYKDQFSMLAEALSQERQEIQTREKAQAQMLQKTKRELRSRMEKEIQQLQAAIMQSDDDTFFQELEADRLKSRLQMVSFQYSKSHFL